MNNIGKIKLLTAELNTYRNEYYNNSTSIISDKEYDDKFDELTSLENETGFYLSNSPTHTVGYKVVDNIPKMEHEIPLLSLGKTKLIDDVIKFADSHALIVMPKFDGLTVCAKYVDGKLESLSTRGNGYVGSDITHNANVIRGIPKQISAKGITIVRGEAVININDFNNVNKRLKDKGENTYSTARNLVSGSIVQLDSKICESRNVIVYFYDVLRADDLKYNTDYLKFEEVTALEELGFNRSPIRVIVKNKLNNEFIGSCIEKIQCACKTNGIPIDGIVFAINDKKYAKTLGITDHHPNSELAFKFYDETTATKLNSIEWSIGKTGVLTPVVCFNSFIASDGATVSQASVHNISIMKSLNLSIGSIVHVSKRNMIIPQVESCDSDKFDIEIPQICPYCHSHTLIKKDNDSEVLICTNENCCGRSLLKFVNFVSREGMDIHGLSKETLGKFMKLGYIKNFVDIYKLNRYEKEIVSLEGCGRKSYDNLWESIQKSRNVKLGNFLVALGIPSIGKGTAKNLAEHYNYDWVDFYSDLCLGHLNLLGTVAKENLCNYFDDFDNRQMALCLVEYLNFVKPKQRENTSSVFTGFKIYCTGTFANYKKEQLKELVESNGGKFASGYAKSLDMLVVGSLKGSGKVDKAKADGVKIVTENEFIGMLKGE